MTTLTEQYETKIKAIDDFKAMFAGLAQSAHGAYKINAAKMPWNRNSGNPFLDSTKDWGISDKAEDAFYKAGKSAGLDRNSVALALDSIKNMASQDKEASIDEVYIKKSKLGIMLASKREIYADAKAKYENTAKEQAKRKAEEEGKKLKPQIIDFSETFANGNNAFTPSSAIAKPAGQIAALD